MSETLTRDEDDKELQIRRDASGEVLVWDRAGDFALFVVTDAWTNQQIWAMYDHGQGMLARGRTQGRNGARRAVLTALGLADDGP